MQIFEINSILINIIYLYHIIFKNAVSVSNIYHINDYAALICLFSNEKLIL